MNENQTIATSEPWNNKSGLPLTALGQAVQGAQREGGGPDPNINAIEYDSRQVRPGALFVAVVGENVDGHTFLTRAVEAGASAVVVQADHAGSLPPISVPVLVVPNTRTALAPLSARCYGDPTRSLFLSGVTGTNGKTTTTRMIDSIARAAGDRTGIIGTIGAVVDGEEVSLPGERTTPEAPDLQRLFARMRDQGCHSASMEVSSHALVSGRVEGCLFDVGVFTNLTQDHLDFHKTMEEYRDAKALLFTRCAKEAQQSGKQFTAVLNGDDPNCAYYRSRIDDAYPVLTYGSSGDVSVRLDEVEARVDGLRFDARVAAWECHLPIALPFGGMFNLYNALAAIGCSVARNLSPDAILQGLNECPPVPGRFQPVRAGQKFSVLVDYAHTPDGLENVLRSARPLTDGRLIVVFGCGGNRDRTKRPKMGKLALDLADIAVVTSDNPRKEEPEAIIDEILTGMTGVGAQVLREADRRAAIALAVREARPGDTVLIAGKGHETYQIVGEKIYPFDDVKVAEEEIRKCFVP